MAKKTKARSESEVVALLEKHIRNAVGYLDGDLKAERLEILEYYQGDKPHRTRKGQSSYVSRDVFDSVEAMHAQLYETFTSSGHLVKFAPQGPEDAVRARAMTEVSTYVIFRQNPGHAILSDVIKDGLMARIGVAKAWWHEEIEEEEVEFEGADPLQLAMQAEAEGIEVDEDSLEENDVGLVSGKGKRTIDRSRVKIEAVPPNEFLVSKRARCLETAGFVAHRVAKTRGELKQMGLTDEDIAKIGRGEDTETIWDEEEQTRFDGIDDGGVFREAEDEDRIWVYECYVKADLDGTGIKRWKVTKVAHRVLEKEPIKRLPFVVFVPLRVPHALWGMNYADTVIPVQKAKTGLVRAILDHTAMTISPRIQVVRGTLTNPNELTDPRLGGIVNVNRPDGLIPLVQQPLNPFVFQTVQMLDADNEDTTGISRLSQGLNKDALSGNNSNALVETLTSNSQTRQKVIAKNFAFQFLIPLYYLVAEILADNATSQMMIEVGGEWQEVPPETWQTKRDLVAEMHLGYGEADREVEKWMMFHQLVGQDPTMAQFYGPQQRYNVYHKVLTLKGCKDTENYLMPPEKAPPPQPDPLMQLEVAARQQELQLKQMEAQLRQLEVQAKIQEMQAKLQLDAAKLAQKDNVDQQKLELERQKHEHDVQVDNAEIQAMKRAQTTEALRAIASPNS